MDGLPAILKNLRPVSRKPMAICRACQRKHHWQIPFGLPDWALIGTGGKGGKFESICPRCYRMAFPERFGKRLARLPDPIARLANCECLRVNTSGDGWNTRLAIANPTATAARKHCWRCHGIGVHEARFMGCLLLLLEDSIMGIYVRGPLTAIRFRTRRSHECIVVGVDLLTALMDVAAVAFMRQRDSTVKREIERRTEVSPEPSIPAKGGERGLPAPA